MMKNKSINNFIKQNKYLLLAVLILLVLVIGITIFQKSYAFEGSSGTSGTCNWTIDTNGKMIIEPSSGSSCTLQNQSSSSSAPWYNYRTNITSVEVKKGVKANTNASFLFDQLTNATSIDVTNLDTSNVTNMDSMFNNCRSLTSLDVTNFNTSKVTNMRYMFANLIKITSLDVKKFDTSEVTNMEGMFYECNSLTSLNLSNFDTYNVRKMGDMFNSCGSLTSLDLSSFNVRYVTGMSGMFAYCNKLKAIYVSDNFNTNNVTSSSSMFHNCTSLVGGNGTAFDSSKTDKEYARIDTASTPGYFTANVVAQSGTSGSCKWEIYTTGKMIIEPSSGSSCTLSEAEEAGNWDKMPWFDYREDILSVEVKEGVKANQQSYNLFSYLTNATSIDVTNLDTSNVTNMYGMFYACSSLTSLDLSNFNTSNVTNMARMFYGCSSLTSLDVTNFNTSNVTDMDWMFDGCINLETIYASDNFDTSSVSDSRSMFSSCTSLVGGNGTAFDSSKIDKEYARIDTTGAPGYFTLKPQSQNVTFIKTDKKTGDPVEGVTFKLYGTSDEGEEINKTETSGSNGKVTFEDIPKGTYKLKETGVPEGYIKSTDEITVEVKR